MEDDLTNEINGAALSSADPIMDDLWKSGSGIEIGWFEYPFGMLEEVIVQTGRVETTSVPQDDEGTEGIILKNFVGDENVSLISNEFLAPGRVAVIADAKTTFAFLILAKLEGIIGISVESNE